MAQASYISLKGQIAKLQAQAEEVRKKEMQSVIQDIQKQMKTYNLSIQDLGIKVGRGRKVESAQPSAKTTNKTVAQPKVDAKFRHPETGATWSGRGRMPKWISEEVKQGRNKQEFAIS